MKITVAVDIMGGDNSPLELARGAISAANEYGDEGLEIILVGTEDAISALPELPDNMSTRISACFVGMTDDPSTVMKDKKDSSMVLACNLCKEGEADAVVSAGNTGALFTAASLIIRRIKGVRRAALGSVIPLEKPFVLLDCGANLDATPEVLSLYARMGSIYAENVLDIEKPRVALLNNGTESHKGTPLYKEAYALLAEDEAINFVGNIDGKAVPFGECDVLVCDGFTGNVLMKTIEGTAGFIMKELKSIMYANLPSKLAALVLKPGLTRLKNMMDYKTIGGAPLLGVSKPVIKAHGSSDARAFCSACEQAMLFAHGGFIGQVEANIAYMTVGKDEA